ncbi:protein transport protein SEC31-like [Miscanthus floridulus]|uniref:protein transport protein SEC31-like n=1 Tax=Miscanthus floridulus TaxID=154761 RepID=UPI0034577A54
MAAGRWPSRAATPARTPARHSASASQAGQAESSRGPRPCQAAALPFRSDRAGQMWLWASCFPRADPAFRRQFFPSPAVPRASLPIGQLKILHRPCLQSLLVPNSPPLSTHHRTPSTHQSPPQASPPPPQSLPLPAPSPSRTDSAPSACHCRCINARKEGRKAGRQCGAGAGSSGPFCWHGAGAAAAAAAPPPASSMLRRHACSLSLHLLLVEEAELARIYDDILALLDSCLVLSASASESKVKMKGDYYRRETRQVVYVRESSHGCRVHITQVINMEFGIVEGLMMTVHATTGSFHCFWITLETVEFVDIDNFQC